MILLLVLLSPVLWGCKDRDDHYEQCIDGCFIQSRVRVDECKLDSPCREGAIQELRGCEKECLDRWKR